MKKKIEFVHDEFYSGGRARLSYAQFDSRGTLQETKFLDRTTEFVAVRGADFGRSDERIRGRKDFDHSREFPLTARRVIVDHQH